MLTYVCQTFSTGGSLCLGGVASANDADFTASMGLVVDCRWDGQPVVRGGVRTVYFKSNRLLMRTASAGAERAFYELLREIAEVILAGADALVHCEWGAHRSAHLVLAFLTGTSGRAADQVEEHMVALRPCCQLDIEKDSRYISALAWCTRYSAML